MNMQKQQLRKGAAMLLNLKVQLWSTKRTGNPGMNTFAVQYRNHTPQ